MSANVRTCARSMRPYIQKEIDTARLASQHKASSRSRALLHLQSTLGALTQRPTPQNMCLQNARQTSHLGEYLKCEKKRPSRRCSTQLNLPPAPPNSMLADLRATWPCAQVGVFFAAPQSPFGHETTLRLGARGRRRLHKCTRSMGVFFADTGSENRSKHGPQTLRMSNKQYCDALRRAATRCVWVCECAGEDAERNPNKDRTKAGLAPS